MRGRQWPKTYIGTYEYRAYVHTGFLILASIKPRHSTDVYNVRTYRGMWKYIWVGGTFMLIRRNEVGKSVHRSRTPCLRISGRPDEMWIRLTLHTSYVVYVIP